MSSIKEQFPDELAVRGAVFAATDNKLEQLFDRFEPQRQTLLNYQRQVIIGTVIVIALAFLSVTNQAFQFNLHWLISVPAFIGVVIGIAAYINAIHRYLKASREYALAFNQALYPTLLQIFGLDIKYSSGIDASDYGTPVSRRSASDDAHHNQVIAELNASELITSTIEHDTVDDIITTTFNDRPLSIAEVQSTRTEGSGKNKRTVTVFKGIFISYDLPRPLSGQTFISTEGDETGFAHRDFWSRITGRSQVEETEFEWNQFERDLHVATSDGTEARYILTPEFMEHLHGWWEGHRRNIRLCFRGHKLYLVFPNKDSKFGQAVTTRNTFKLQEYALSIALPIWRVLLLLEDVNERFRY